MLRGNAIVGQSGGPTSVINTSLAGIIAKAKECEGIHNVFGMRYGIEGFMAENIINLSDQPTSIPPVPWGRAGINCRKRIYPKYWNC
ncbi:MAG: hypothetical protein ACYSUH_03190 [Planctomycetota bacterium]